MEEWQRKQRWGTVGTGKEVGVLVGSDFEVEVI